uniref:Uncharacterized protein n=1 Tax=Candidatus Kentrum sp. LFY TaxID=2126342 RepID=A0A450WXP7_9GAMM|nr:MAG: hypothetical protein BECKLFY1418C_GA0070996_11041 [Candidatus Kentron sp. LFY]
MAPVERNQGSCALPFPVLSWRPVTSNTLVAPENEKGLDVGVVAAHSHDTTAVIHRFCG